MRGHKIQNNWNQTRGKKQAHWSILTLDDLPKTNGKYSQLIAEFKARYQVAKELGKNTPKKKSEDFSI
jgi:uncharacterized protein YjbJ (UPF0337 family)